MATSTSAPMAATERDPERDPDFPNDDEPLVALIKALEAEAAENVENVLSAEMELLLAMAQTMGLPDDQLVPEWWASLTLLELEGSDAVMDRLLELEQSDHFVLVLIGLSFAHTVLSGIAESAGRSLIELIREMRLQHLQDEEG